MPTAGKQKQKVKICSIMDYRVNGPRPRPPEGQFMGDLCRAAVVVVIGIPLTTLSSLSPTFPPFLCVVLLTSATLFTSLGVEFEEGARHLKILNLLRGRLINGQPSLSDRYTYDVLQEIANHLLARTQLRPKIGIILGTGLGSLANQLTDADYIDYQTIPHFPVSTVEGHVGRLIFGYLKGVPVMCMQGRFHYYEGYPLAKCAMPVRVMKLVGCSHLIATNAAGGLHPDYKVGDIMLMKDHINIMGFAGNNPLQGPNDSRFGPRFPNMFNAYDFKLLKKAKEIGRDIGIENNLHEGVYICLGGPNFETVAELKMLRIWGVDAVGMSTVHEITTAVHCGMTCFAFSLITNLCIPSYDLEESPCHEDIVGIGKRQENTLTELVSRMAKHIHMELKK